VLVCHCLVVNDRRIRDEIDRGACDEADVALACGAGSECGGCGPMIRRLLREAGADPLEPPAAPVHGSPTVVDAGETDALGCTGGAEPRQS
jgi:bacterioferritin-associated ferredoxin